MLSLRNVSAAYGASRVLFDVSFDLREGEVATLLGRNGMGKTTTIRTITGLLAPTGGEISFQGQQISGLAPEKIARLGSGLVPEGRQIFATLTVRENLVATAANRSGRADPWTLARISPTSLKCAGSNASAGDTQFRWRLKTTGSFFPMKVWMVS